MGWAFILGVSVYVTWIMNNTGNSVLMALLFHWSFNLVTSAILPLTTIVPAYGIFITIVWVIDLGLIGLFGSKRLARTSTASL